MARRSDIDWDAVEGEYRINKRTLRDIAADYGCTEGAVRKQAKKLGWERDLSAKVAAKAEALVRKTEVRNKVRSESIISERRAIEVSAQVMADKVINQREDVQRARNIVNKLFAEVEAECDNKMDMAQLGELMAAPDDNGRDRLNEMYRAAISLPERIKSARALADALKVLIELERKVLRISDAPEQINANVTVDSADPSLSPAEAYLRMIGKK